jgi:pullulanase/glycogen debranching enzyme
MIEALKYWITEADIDGYRCDMAGLVPTDFWETARVELDKVKPVFMLAEAEQADLLQKAFDLPIIGSAPYYERYCTGQKRFGI